MINRMPVTNPSQSRLCITLGILLGLTGCTHYQARPLDLHSSAQQFAAASLSDEQLAARLAALNLQNPAYSGKWDRAQLLVVASERNPKLMMARSQMKAASAARTTAGALPNPTLSLGSEYNLSQSTESPWLWSVTTDWLLDAGLHRQLRMDLADTGLNAARLEYAEILWSVRSELRAALLGYFISSQRIQLLNRTINNQEQLLELHRQRITQGEAVASDALQVELELARERSNLAESLRLQNVSLAQIATATGMPIAALQTQSMVWDDVLHVASIDEVQLDHLRDNALLSRADLERAVSNYQGRELELQQAVRQQYPQISIGPGFSWDHGVKKVSLGLSVGLPVFNRNQGPIAEAEAARELAGEQVLQVQSQILNEIESARQAYLTSVQSLQEAVKQHDAADKLSVQAQQAMTLGATDRIEVIAAQLLVTTQSLTVLDNVERMQQALGQLEDALRTPLSGPELELDRKSLLEVSGAGK